MNQKTKLQNLIKENPNISPDEDKMQILNELAAQMDMVISPEPSAGEKLKNTNKIKNKNVQVRTPKIEEIEDSENQNHDPDKKFWINVQIVGSA